jgi:hypothetical protein
VPKGGIIGRHRHRGSVIAMTLEGSWRYLEYDWVARPGSYILESPGVIHTLSAGPGMKTFFAINGTLEFFDEADRLTQVQDVFWAINCYLHHCRRALCRSTTPCSRDLRPSNTSALDIFR